MPYQPPRKTALPVTAVLLLHGLLGLLLIQQRSLPQASHRRSEVRLIPLKLPPPPPPAAAPTPARALATAAPRPAMVPVPEFSSAQPAPGAITLPAAPASAAEGAATPRPLNLNLPKGWQPSQDLSPAQQAVQDPRANSPRYSAEERMARAIANEPVTIELAGGGTMTRWPDGRCTRTLPNRSNQLVPMDSHLQVGTSHGGNCFNDKPGSAIRHTRPR
ncbi:hypothetical protein [Inhella proteolytica]|uniref:Uncharacterized protein n=1 Tax=Inhella proteolytica TaxID=2795029 RepID=A0A931J888_9BURK|nr:hypothetical protein [Inhella proteolytica]MBH9578182.1 hypothetical protein [Inhella proteolytica]